MDVGDKRFDLMKELSQDPPFWFDHALMYCRFKPSQLHHLLQGTISRAVRSDRQTCVVLNNDPWYIQRAVECGLLEPILQSAAEYDGDLDQLMKTLVDASHCMTQNFPWMFLAYIGTRNTNIVLVQKCVNNIIGDLKKGKRLTNEIGMVYVVWRFLVQAQCTSEWEALLKHHHLEGPREHDWTFVHLASAHGDADCLEILLNLRCNQNHGVLSAATELEGFTPLHLAAWYGHLDAVKILLKHADNFPAAPSAAQADIPGPDRIFGRSPLHHASHHAHQSVVAILVEKWGTEGVELQDCFGITSLHLSAAPASLKRRVNDPFMFFGTASKLYKEQKKRFQTLTGVTVYKDFAMQKAAMVRLFLQRRRYIDSTTSTLFIPSPRIADGFVWTIQGFTFFHYVAVYMANKNLSCFNRQISEKIMGCGVELEDEEWVTIKDCGGLTPSDYGSEEAHGKILEGDPTADQMWRLSWVYNIDIYLLSGDYSRALELFKNVHFYVSDLYTAIGEKVFKLDDEVWDHLEWALDKALQQDSDIKVNNAPRLHASDAEEMLLILVQNQVLYGQSPKQRCLQWAITKRMARLANELVKDTECELISVLPGGKHVESPLARASKSKEMAGLLAAMELRDDVKRRWFEDRQVYVSYANTLLVGAVLIAGLAFAGWLQPPRGYTDGIIDMKRLTIRVFLWSSCLAFFLGMGTVVAGATGAMPFEIGAGQFVSAREKVHESVVIASMFLVASIMCLAIAFSSAALAILPNLSHHVSIIAFLAVNALFLCYMLWSFLKRLQVLAPSPKSSKWIKNYTLYLKSSKWVKTRKFCGLVAHHE